MERGNPPGITCLHSCLRTKYVQEHNAFANSPMYHHSHVSALSCISSFMYQNSLVTARSSINTIMYQHFHVLTLSCISTFIYQRICLSALSSYQHSHVFTLSCISWQRWRQNTRWTFDCSVIATCFEKNSCLFQEHIVSLSTG